MRFIDLSVRIENDMPVYPGDIKVSLTQTHEYKSDKYSNHQLQTEMHAGTHLDGPMHLTDSGDYICSFDLDKFYGQACILRAQNESIIKQKDEYRSYIKGKTIVLIDTGFNAYYGEQKYYQEHPVLDLLLCEFFVQNGIKMVGIDAPSPDRFPFEVHKYLLSHNIMILENLTNLDKIPDNSNFEVIAFPLNIKADSSPVRAVARII